MATIEPFGKSRGMTLADLKDNEALIIGILVAAYFKYGEKTDWVTALGAGVATYYLTDKAKKARALKALKSLPEGATAKPTKETLDKLRVVKPPTKEAK